MKLKTIYERAIKEGIKHDPRGEKAVKEQLRLEKERYESLSEKEKKIYDKERLTNPYVDSRIIHGDPNTEVKTAMVGIDLEAAEILLSERLKEKGKKIDLLISHHPEGQSYARLHEVMSMHVDIFNKFGVPITIAEELTKERQREVGRALGPGNHFRNVDTAKLLNVPFMCMHTPADNHVATYLQDIFDKRKPKYVKDIVDILHEIPEYQIAEKTCTGPVVLLGDKNNRAGKVFVDMTGGTEGSKEIFSHLAQHGVGTIITMHVHEGHYKRAKEVKMNIIIAGHIASDGLGINLALDNILGNEKVDIVEASGFRRVDRRKKK